MKIATVLMYVSVGSTICCAQTTGEAFLTLKGDQTLILSDLAIYGYQREAAGRMRERLREAKSKLSKMHEHIIAPISEKELRSTFPQFVKFDEALGELDAQIDKLRASPSEGILAELRQEAANRVARRDEHAQREKQAAIAQTERDRRLVADKVTDLTAKVKLTSANAWGPLLEHAHELKSSMQSARDTNTREWLRLSNTLQGTESRSNENPDSKLNEVKPGRPYFPYSDAGNTVAKAFFIPMTVENPRLWNLIRRDVANRVFGSKDMLLYDTAPTSGSARNIYYLRTASLDETRREAILSYLHAYEAARQQHTVALQKLQAMRPAFEAAVRNVGWSADEVVEIASLDNWRDRLARLTNELERRNSLRVELGSVDLEYQRLLSEYTQSAAEQVAKAIEIRRSGLVELEESKRKAIAEIQNLRLRAYDDMRKEIGEQVMGELMTMRVAEARTDSTGRFRFPNQVDFVFAIYRPETELRSSVVWLQGASETGSIMLSVSTSLGQGELPTLILSATLDGQLARFSY